VGCQKVKDDYESVQPWAYADLRIRTMLLACRLLLGVLMHWNFDCKGAPNPDYYSHSHKDGLEANILVVLSPANKLKGKRDELNEQKL